MEIFNETVDEMERGMSMSRNILYKTHLTVTDGKRGHVETIDDDSSQEEHDHFLRVHCNE
jgi:hypothetical protein